MLENYLTTHNAKLGNTPSFNLPRIITCKPNLLCHKFCYCNKGNFRYNPIISVTYKRYEESLLKSFVPKMIQECNIYKYVRLHSQGDFYSLDYINKWFNIAYQSPTTIFYAYTKRDDLFTKEVLSRKPKNLILIFSFDGIDCDITNKEIQNKLDIGFNKVAYINSNKTTCLNQLDKSKKCGSHCTKCFKSNCKKIIFKKH